MGIDQIGTLFPYFSSHYAWSGDLCGKFVYQNGIFCSLNHYRGRLCVRLHIPIPYPPFSFLYSPINGRWGEGMGPARCAPFTGYTSDSVIVVSSHTDLSTEGQIARERRDREGCIRGRGPQGRIDRSHGREIFHFWGSESCNLVHAVMKFLTLYLIRIWIKIITYSTTHTETGSE